MHSSMYSTIFAAFLAVVAMTGSTAAIQLTLCVNQFDSSSAHPVMVNCSSAANSNLMEIMVRMAAAPTSTAAGKIVCELNDTLKREAKRKVVLRKDGMIICDSSTTANRESPKCTHQLHRVEDSGVYQCETASLRVSQSIRVYRDLTDADFAYNCRSYIAKNDMASDVVTHEIWLKNSIETLQRLSGLKISIDYLRWHVFVPRSLRWEILTEVELRKLQLNNSLIIRRKSLFQVVTNLTTVLSHEFGQRTFNRSVNVLKCMQVDAPDLQLVRPSFTADGKPIISVVWRNTGDKNLNSRLNRFFSISVTELGDNNRFDTVAEAGQQNRYITHNFRDVATGDLERMNFGNAIITLKKVLQPKFHYSLTLENLSPCKLYNISVTIVHEYAHTSAFSKSAHVTTLVKGLANPIDIFQSRAYEMGCMDSESSRNNLLLYTSLQNCTLVNRIIVRKVQVDGKPLVQQDADELPISTDTKALQLTGYDSTRSYAIEVRAAYDDRLHPVSSIITVLPQYRLEPPIIRVFNQPSPADSSIDFTFDISWLSHRSPPGSTVQIAFFISTAGQCSTKNYMVLRTIASAELHNKNFTLRIPLMEFHANARSVVMRRRPRFGISFALLDSQGSSTFASGVSWTPCAYYMDANYARRTASSLNAIFEANEVNVIWHDAGCIADDRTNALFTHEYQVAYCIVRSRELPSCITNESIIPVARRFDRTSHNTKLPINVDSGDVLQVRLVDSDLTTVIVIPGFPKSLRYAIICALLLFVMLLTILVLVVSACRRARRLEHSEKLRSTSSTARSSESDSYCVEYIP